MKSILKKSKERHFDNFVREVENITKIYVFWDRMQMSKYKGRYDENKNFWLTVFYSMQGNLIVNLHNIFTEDDETLNVYTLYKNIDSVEIKKQLELEEVICRNCILKLRIKNFRDNLVAHKNKKTIDKNIEELNEKYLITAGFLQDLVLDLYEIIEILKVIYDKSQDDYWEIKSDIEENISRELDFMIMK